MALPVSPRHGFVQRRRDTPLYIGRLQSPLAPACSMKGVGRGEGMCFEDMLFHGILWYFKVLEGIIWQLAPACSMK